MLPPGNVAGDQGHALDDVAADGTGGDLQRAHGTVLAGDAQLLRQHALPARGPGQQGRRHQPVLGRDQVDEVLAEHLVPGRPEQAGGGVVPANNGTIACCGHQRVRGILQDGGQVALSQGAAVLAVPRETTRFKARHLRDLGVQPTLETVGGLAPLHIDTRLRDGAAQIRRVRVRGKNPGIRNLGREGQHAAHALQPLRHRHEDDLPGGSLTPEGCRRRERARMERRHHQDVRV
nr:hypothetical protein [Pseudoroseomonas vastitatis]